MQSVLFYLFSYSIEHIHELNNLVYEAIVAAYIGKRDVDIKKKSNLSINDQSFVAIQES